LIIIHLKTSGRDISRHLKREERSAFDKKEIVFFLPSRTGPGLNARKRRLRSAGPNLKNSIRRPAIIVWKKDVLKYHMKTASSSWIYFQESQYHRAKPVA